MNRTTLIIAALAAAPALAGDLDPATGPVTPTMKSLDQIEPRVVLNDLPGDASAVHLITEPGNYYLTANITVPAGRSATVVDLAADPADDPVIIDLNGFSILGEAGSLDGVRFTADFENGRYILRAGVPLRLNTGSTIAGMGGHAVSYNGSPALVDGAAPVLISGLSVSNCGGDAIHIENARATYVFDLTVTDNTGLATLVSGSGRSVVVENVTATNCLAGGTEIQDRAEVRVEKFSARNCGGPGLSVTAATGGPFKFTTKEGNLLSNAGPGIRVDVSGTTGATIRVNNTTAADNTSHGIHVLGSGLSTTPGFDSATVAHEMGHNFSTNNGGDGIHVELDDSASPRLHCYSSTMAGNGGDGLHCVGAANLTFNNVRVQDSDASANAGSGLRVSGNLTVSGATLSGNTGDGLHHTTPGEPVGGINVSLEQITGSNNQGSGLRFHWEQLSGPVALRVSNTTTDHNDEYGNWIDDDSDNDCIIEFDACAASGNGLAGFAEDHPLSATAKKSTRRKQCTAHTNAGPGFVVTNARSEFIQCAAEDNTGSGFDVLADLASFRQCTASGNTAHGYASASPTGGAARASKMRPSSMRRLRGIKVSLASYHSDFIRSIASGNGQSGFDIDTDHCRITSCDSTGNQQDGFAGVGESFIIDGCVSTGNDDDGFDLSTGVALADYNFKKPSASLNGGHGIRVTDGNLTLTGGALSGNTGNGLAAIGSNSVSVSETALDNNTLAGAFFQDIDGNNGLDRVRATGNGAGGLVVVNGATLHVSGGTFSNNTGAGASIEVSGTLTVSGATMCTNTGSGLVHASSIGIPAAAVHVDHCVASNNTLSGISIADSSGGRVQHCSAFSNGSSGIEVLAFAHVVTNNMCGNNPTNLAVTLPGNTLGPSQDELSAPTTDNASNYIP